MKNIKLLKEIKESHKGAVRALKYMPMYYKNNLILLSGGDDGAVRAWQKGFLNTYSNTEYLGHNGSVLDIDCFPEVSLFLSSATDGKVILRGIVNGNKKQVILDSEREFPSRVIIDSEKPSFVSIAHMHPSPNIAVIHSSYGLFTWNWERNLLFELPAKEIPFFSTKVIFSEKRKFIITNSGKAIYILNSVNGDLIRAFGGHAKGIRRGDDILSLKWDEIQEKASELMGGHKKDVSCFSLSNGGNFLLSGSYDCTIHRWNISDPSNIEPMGVKIMEGHRGAITNVSFLQKSSIAASCSIDGTLRLWDSEASKELFQINMNTPLYAMAVSFDGSRLAVGGGNGSIYIFEL